MPAVGIKRLMTPPINAKGKFTLYEPFVLNLSMVYQCSAIRSFKELSDKGVDIFTAFYEPVGLPITSYEEDLKLKSSIITLTDTNGAHIYIPDIYIESYPGSASVTYERKLLLIELGLVPSNVDVSFLITELTSLVASNIGVTATPEVATIEVDGTITAAQHSTMELARITAIHDNVPLMEQVQLLKNELAVVKAREEELLNLIAQYPELEQP